MGYNSGVSWTHHTFNPWWGCTKVSSGCTNCYAQTFADGRTPFKGLWGPDAPRRVVSDHAWRQPIKWARDAAALGERQRVFCGSMCDYLEDRRDLDAPRERLWGLILATSYSLDWLLLTKRADRLSIVPVDVARACWMGVTVEDQRAAKERVPHLLRSPAAVRWISAEPMLGGLDLRQWAGGSDGEPRAFNRGLPGITSCTKCGLAIGDGYEDPHLCPPGFGPSPDWVVVGGESGSQRRELDMSHLLSVVVQCRRNVCPVYVKQDSGARSGQQGRIPDDVWALKQFPVTLDVMV